MADSSTYLQLKGTLLYKNENSKNLNKTTNNSYITKLHYWQQGICFNL